MKLVDIPLNLTMLAPVKCVPPIVTHVPTAPLAGESPLIEGPTGAVTVTVGGGVTTGATTTGGVTTGDGVVTTGAGVVTAKVPALVAVPALVVTVTGPLVAAAGTFACSCESLSTPNCAETPLNLTDVAEPRCAPVIVTVVPAVPPTGEKPPSVGRAAGVAATGAGVAGACFCG